MNIVIKFETVVYEIKFIIDMRFKEVYLEEEKSIN